MAALAVGAQFDCYDDFMQILTAYGQQKNVNWVKDDCKTVEATNKSLGPSAQPFHERFVYRYVRFTCKHWGERRNFKRPVGLRPNQRSFKISCPSEVYVSVNRKLDKLVIQKAILEHNHELSDQHFKQYPKQRRLADPQTAEMVETMLEMKVKVKILQDYIQSQGTQWITTKDSHNIRQKMKKLATGNKSEEELLLDELQRLGDADPDAALSVQTSDNGDLEFLLVATGEMRRTFKKFPEVLMIDGTYRVNKLMPLYVFLVEDGNGQGRITGFSLVSNEKRGTLENLTSEYGRIHDLNKVKTVIVDKDMNEINAVEKAMPHVSIQISKFHVMQAFNREIKKCAIEQTAKTRLTQTVRQIVYARSQVAFDTAVGQLVKIAPQHFTIYFNKNWAGSAHMWCAYQTNVYIKLGNTTNNRLESLNQKIKEVLDRNMSIPEVIQGMLLICRSSIYGDQHKSFVQKLKVPYKLNDDDKVVEKIMKILTPYAANIVTSELTAARKHIDSVASDDANCCAVKTSMGLPCRHVFACRVKAEDTSIFLESDVLPRWFIGYGDQPVFRSTLEQISTSEPGTSASKQSSRFAKMSKPNPRSKEEKFRDIMVICKSMADLCSNLGSIEFSEKMDTLKQLFHAWNRGEKVVLVEVVSTDMANTAVLSKEEPVLNPSVDADDFQSKQAPSSPVFLKSKINKRSTLQQSPSSRPQQLTAPLQDQTTTSFSQVPSYSQVQTPVSSQLQNASSSLLQNPSAQQHQLGPSFQRPTLCSQQRQLPLTPKKPNSSKRQTPSLPQQKRQNTQTSQQQQTIPILTRRSPSSQRHTVSSLQRHNPVLIHKKISVSDHTSSSSTVENNTITTGITADVVHDIPYSKIRLPTSPPIRGRSRVKKVTGHSSNKENIFKSRARKLGTLKKIQKVTTSQELQPMEMRSLRENGMLLDTHINMASLLLKKDNPFVQGLQDPVLGSKLQFDVCKGKFVQILHDGNLHWLTVSNMSSNDDVDIYDSLPSPSGYIAETIKMGIAAIVMQRGKTLKLRLRKCQRQIGGTDCGLFAIAFATSLCNSKDPSTITYSQQQMRQHLEQCFKSRKMEDFPSSDIQSGKISSKEDLVQKINVYCVCRLPDNNEERMIECSQCKEWFHQTCLSIKSKMFRDENFCEKWTCPQCLN